MMKTHHYGVDNHFYRSRRGVIFGVCRGIAEYFDFSVFWTRIIALAVLLITGFWPVTGLYFLAALMMKPEPALPITNEDEQEFYDSYLKSRSGASSRIRRRYENLDRRIRRMEDQVTDKAFTWDRRMDT